ncbi:acyltransferase family protein [Pseudoalteromonas gelatinilytica]
MNNQRYTSLDAFRGLAAILVLLFHTPFVNMEKPSLFVNSDIFVDFFFILSGFVISHSYLERFKSGYPFQNFVQNRFARIYPLHFSLLIVWLIFLTSKFLIFSFLNINASSPFEINDSYAFLLQFVLLNAHGLDNHLSWNIPAWSIGAEFYTYISFYLIAVGFKIYERPFVFLVLAIAAFSLIYILKPMTLLRTFDLGYVRSLGGFFVGVFIFMHKDSLKSVINNLNSHSESIIEIMLIASICLSVSYLAPSKNGQLIIFMLFAVTILFFSHSSGIVTKMLNSSFTQQLGALSYSIYLIHFLVITIFANGWELLWPETVSYIGNNKHKVFQTEWAFFINLAIAAATYSCSLFTYKFIEKPFQKRLSIKSITK